MPLADLVADLLRDRNGRASPVAVASETDPKAVATPTDKTFLDFIRRTAPEERVLPPPTPETWYRVSSLGHICPREEVLAGLTKTVRRELVTADEVLNFGIGTGWHFIMQNQHLGPHGILLGKWECWNCHQMYGRDAPDGGVSRPMKCERCETDRFLYHELYLRNEEHRIHGHPDGIIVLGKRKRLLELKTVNENGFKNRVDMSPDPAHLIQANVYMWMTGIREALVVYVNKNGYGLRALRPYEIDYDKDLVKNTLSMISTIRHNLKTGELPGRLSACDRPSADRVKECPMGKICMGCKNRLEEAA